MESEMGHVLEVIKGYGGYTTTASIWAIALITWWKGLPAMIEVGDRLLENWAKRRGAFEDRINRLLNEQEARFKSQLDDADRRHADCVDGQDKLRAYVELITNQVFASSRDHHLEVKGLQERITGLEQAFTDLRHSAGRAVRGEITLQELGELVTDGERT